MTPKGSWGVVEEEEGEGVGELLEAANQEEGDEGEVKGGDEAGDAEESKDTPDEEAGQKEDSGTSSRASEDTNDESEEQRLAEAAATVGWQLVNGPKKYWYNAALNQTCWDTPKAVVDALASGIFSIVLPQVSPHSGIAFSQEGQGSKRPASSNVPVEGRSRCTRANILLPPIHWRDVLGPKVGS